MRKKRKQVRYRKSGSGGKGIPLLEVHMNIQICWWKKRDIKYNEWDGRIQFTPLKKRKRKRIFYRWEKKIAELHTRKLRGLLFNYLFPLWTGRAAQGLPLKETGGEVVGLPRAEVLLNYHTELERTNRKNIIMLSGSYRCPTKIREINI